MKRATKFSPRPLLLLGGILFRVRELLVDLTPVSETPPNSRGILDLRPVECSARLREAHVRPGEAESGV
jgi:hypothetical protein